MSSTLTIDGEEYITAVMAGKRFGYTKDYFLMLAKQGKIEGQKIKNRWYINPTSAELFFKENEKRKQERSKMVRAERKRELEKHSEEGAKKFNNKEVEVFLYKKPLAALMLASLIFLATSLVVQPTENSRATASVYTSEFNSLERLAISVFDFFSPKEKTRSKEFVFGSQIDPKSDSHRKPTPTTPHQITHTSLVIAPDEVFTATTVESIQDSFSDEVEISVDPDNPDTGIIIPKFRERDGEAYRFLMVPVNQNTQ